MADVFCLTKPDGQLLDLSLQATVLAKYSRSPLSAREILSTLTTEESNKFYDKWVIEYGHNSVAELASVPICIEGLSILATKMVESMQRGAFSEKSTRYQRFSKDSFVLPPGADPSMKEFAGRFYDAYDRLSPKVFGVCEKRMSGIPGVTKRAIEARVFDNLRYLLPAGTGTNMACVLNLRDARDLITVMLGHSNSEFRDIGSKMLDSIKSICPVLVRHTEPNSFDLKIKSLGEISGFDRARPNWNVSLIDIDTSEREMIRRIETRLGISWESFSEHMETRGQHQQAPHMFRDAGLWFDVLMDFGAYRDLQRHRRCEQFSEPLTTKYGFVIPDDILGTDAESEYVDVMGSAATYASENDDTGQYVIPLGYLHRTIYKMDLQELYYMVELRTKPHGHMSYRRVAYQMYELAKERYPKLMKWCRAVKPDAAGLHL